LTADVRPGAIVCTHISTINPPKKKFGLIAHIDVQRDSVVLLLIHSVLPEFIKNSSTLIKGVTKIPKADHQKFLKYDSWLRFGEPHACSYASLVAQVGFDQGCFCGYATDALLKQLMELIPKCPELSARWQGRYCDALASVLTKP
jgi:hypothetical protein